MTHPTREEMMGHLYGENSAAEKSAIEAHLRACAECRTQSEGWRGTMRSLDRWDLPTSRGSLPFLPLLRWAAAAAILIGLGFVGGRLAQSGPQSLQATLRQEIATQVAAAMNRERTTLAADLRAAASQSAGQETRQLLTNFAEQLDERRQADAEVFYSTIQQLVAQNSQEVGRLRRDLSTVAVVADARLSDAQKQITELYNGSVPTE